MFRSLLCVVRHHSRPLRCVDKFRYVATTIALNLRMYRPLFFAYVAALPKYHMYQHQNRYIHIFGNLFNQKQQKKRIQQNVERVGVFARAGIV